VITVYVSIGNSDDKLTQRRWADFCTDVYAELESLGQIHGDWYSLPDSPWQNACWCVEFESAERAELAREGVVGIRRNFGQDSAAWAVASTEFV
jgi:hypothetical protein